MRLRSVILLFLILLPALLLAEVTIREEAMTVPTYVVGPPDPNPMFYTGRTYQGAKGAVYPYPLYDKLTDKKEDHTYRAVWLENEYVKICVLPELGGRIFAAVDKTNGYDFFYRQHVVKPALIGMLGAWISGGVEWNFPHHHRASSLLPVQYKLEENADGSKTVWVGEMELRHRMRWAVGLTLRPGRSFVEATAKLLNDTPLPNTMLYFANVAVHTNDNYQIIFPPGTQFVTQHAKREFARWPTADSVYASVDFSKGVDVSRWKNHPNSISMFAWNYEDDFVAGYDHGKRAGTLHVADHHVVPGKKFFAWGTGPGGRIWDKILTDEDGPYLELMVGAYSDNQPDYSWLQPFETKTFTQVWYPFRDIGGVKNATRDAAVNLERISPAAVKVGFNATSAIDDATVSLTLSGQPVFTEKISISPGKPWAKEIAVPAGAKDEELRASLSAGGRELIAYSPLKLDRPPMPDPVQPPPPPARMKTNEELYLAGLRLEQFHSPALEPYPYYEEALRRDPGDARVNTALGILYCKRAMYAKAEEHLKAAVARLSKNYTSPKDVEPYYYLGLAQKAQGAYKEAFDSFYKAAWGYAWQAPAYFSLAEVAGLQNRPAEALKLVERSLATNLWNTRALSLKAALLRHLDRPQEALAAAEAITAVDPLDLRAQTERFLAQQLSSSDFRSQLKRYPSTGLEVAVDYGNGGLYEDALKVLAELATVRPDPMAHYFAGLYQSRLGHRDKAAEECRRASQMPNDLVFPFQQEASAALQHALSVNPDDARALYYHGNLVFDWNPATAVADWEKAASLEPGLAVVHRNLAVAYAQKNEMDKAIAKLEKAVELNSKDAMYLFELDQLYERSGAPIERRLAIMDRHSATVEQRDDTLSRHVALRVQRGEYDRAIDILATRHFHNWEGGVRINVGDPWVDAHLLRGQKRQAAGESKAALADFEAALSYPETLEQARRYRGGRLPEVLYWVGTAREAAGDKAGAAKAWKESVAQLSGDEENPHATIRTAQILFYQARSLDRLGDAAKAQALYRALVDTGSKALSSRASADFFAKFGEGQSKRAHDAEAHYVTGLGLLGLNDTAKAKAEFAKAVELNGYHLGARSMLSAVK